MTASTLNSLSIRWTAPTNTGPAINDYDVQYSDGGSFEDWPHTGPGTSTTITGLEADTPYEVQVLARSDEGESLWSESVDGRTVANQAPTFNQGSQTTRSLAENTTGTHDIGNPVTATDRDGGTLTYRLAGTDAASFGIDANDGQLQTRSGETYDFEDQARYEVTVRVEDGQGGSNTIVVTINLIDEREPPEDPAAPSVRPASSTSLAVTWTEPANTGPDISDYDVRYREGDSGGFSFWRHDSADRTATITSLTPGTPPTRCRCSPATTKGRATGRPPAREVPAPINCRCSPTGRAPPAASTRTPPACRPSAIRWAPPTRRTPP